MVLEDKRLARLRRKKRIRKKVFGVTDCPRLCVFRSARHIYAQITDDSEGHTLVSASTLDRELRSGSKINGKITKATEVGKLIAQRALAKGIKKVVFDRGGYLYHGRVKALADAAREGGLEF